MKMPKGSNLIKLSTIIRSCVLFVNYFTILATIDITPQFLYNIKADEKIHPPYCQKEEGTPFEKVF